MILALKEAGTPQAVPGKKWTSLLTQVFIVCPAVIAGLTLRAWDWTLRQQEARILFCACLVVMIVSAIFIWWEPAVKKPPEPDSRLCTTHFLRGKARLAQG